MFDSTAESPSPEKAKTGPLLTQKWRVVDGQGMTYAENIEKRIFQGYRQVAFLKRKNRCSISPTLRKQLKKTNLEPIDDLEYFYKICFALRKDDGTPWQMINKSAWNYAHKLIGTKPRIPNRLQMERFD